MRINLYRLNEATPFVSAFFVGSGAVLTSGWIVEKVAQEFSCDENDVGEIETEDGDVITVSGVPAARCERLFGWRAT